MRALGDNQPSSAEERRSELGSTISTSFSGHVRERQRHPPSENGTSELGRSIISARRSAHVATNQATPEERGASRAWKDYLKPSLRMSEKRKKASQ